MAQTPDQLIKMQQITDTLEENYMPYAMSVIVSRAIPEIDGFKPSHRKILYTMYKMGLLGGTRTKSANVVGQTMKLNPHGDQAIYETLVRLTRGNAALLHPYIDSKGNFGKQYSRDMHYAAARYTEVKLDRICDELFRSLDKNSVDFVDNYDGTMQEPMLLPATFPSILVNSNQGIAVGMASNICSFNLTEVCQAAIAYIKDPAVVLTDIVRGPDFTTGGEIIYDEQEMLRIFKTGRGSIPVRGVYHIDKKNSLIEISEIPYTTTVEAIIDEIANLVKQGKVKEINDVRDETDLDGLNIVIEYRKSSDPEALVKKLFRFTSLQSNFACNFNILVNGTPRVMGVKSIIGEWLSWRRMCIRREISYDLEKKQDRLHLLQGLEKILLDIDKAIRIVRETEKETDVIPNLMQGFGIDAAQAEYVAEIRLRQLNRQYILQRTGDIKTLKKEISLLREILSEQEKIDQLIVEKLEDVIKKYGRPRLTKFIDSEEVEEVKEHQLIDDYRLRLFLTEHGYLKKLALTSLRSAGELKTKEDDQIVQELEGKNKSDILCFSDQGNVYKLKCYELKDHKPSDLGEYTPNLLEMDEEEKIVFIHITDNYEGDLMFGYASGKIARIPLAAYETKTNRRKLVNAYSIASPLVAIHFLEQDDEYVAFSNIRKTLVFNSASIPVKATRTTQGIKVMLSKKGSLMTVLKKLEDSNIANAKPYRTKRIPAVGTFLREENLVDRQLGMDDL